MNVKLFQELIEDWTRLADKCETSAKGKKPFDKEVPLCMEVAFAYCIQGLENVLSQVTSEKEKTKMTEEYFKSEEYLKAQEISKRSITEMLEICVKAERFDQMKEILAAFFLEKANPPNLTDYAECYCILGKLRDLTVITSEIGTKEET